MKYSAHESSIIDDGATIGEGTKIWHWVHVCSGAVIGEGCSLGQNVFIGNNVVIGNNVKIQNNVSVYDNVRIEDDVFCGPSMVFTNVYNPRSAVSRKDEYKDTLIKKGATLGANATIVCGNTIGNYAFIGAGSVITNSVKDFSLVVGVPGREIGWISRYGKGLDFLEGKKGVAICEHTGDKYILENNLCSLMRK